ncbi:MAG: tRNA lysidine(34) synthetase TilS [Candidatus Hatepunaea meridiana]|nr:tRNA lysidine(34) synthetase TilS [Candidatus Hatepunaea meridiana]
MGLYSRFIKNCHQCRTIQAGDDIIVAFSGGPDSTALLHLLHTWRISGGQFDLIASHYNHKIRPEADSEQKHAVEFCLKLGIPCITGAGDVLAEARNRGVSVHVAAREMRYDFLINTAIEKFRSIGKRHVAGESTKYEKLIRCQCATTDSNTPYNAVNHVGLIAGDSNFQENSRCLIVTGHHRDDQAETILMRLFNGAGVEGLSGIKRFEIWKGNQDILVSRPLLDFSRMEIETYCQHHQLTYVEDRSNLDTKYPRNRIRYIIIPFLKEQFGESVVKSIVRSGELLRMTTEQINETTKEAVSKTIINKSKDEIVLDYSLFFSYLEVLRLKILQYAACNLSSEHNRFTLERYQTADRYLSSGRSGIVEMGNDIRIYVSGKKIFIYRSVQTEWQKWLSPNNSIEIPGYGLIEAQLLPRNLCSLPPPSDSLFCDYRKIGKGPFIVRPAQKGDRITPYGMTGQRKVRDILREAGIPIHRRCYPIVMAGDQIAVVPPFRIAEPFKLTDKTSQVLVFRFVHSKH